MAKQRMIVTDDQLLIDMDLVFSAIRNSEGDWEDVAQDMRQYVDMVKGMLKIKPVVQSGIPRQRMIVTDDQLLIDMDLLFNAIEEANGDWEKVEEDMQAYLDSITGMVEDSDDDDDDDADDDDDDDTEASEDHK